MTVPGERTHRLFVGLWPPDELRAEIEQETRHAVLSSEGRRIPAENFHITLVFLGSVAEIRIPDVCACMEATQVQPFDFTLSRITWWGRQKLLCLEPLATSGALAEAVERLKWALREKGFPPEPRRFRAHLTLARDVCGQYAVKSVKELHWQVNRIELIESRTSPLGSVYSVLPC